MEPASTPVLTTTRLQCVANSHVEANGHSNHLSHLCIGSRAGHALHFQEMARLRCILAVLTGAVRLNPTIAVGTKETPSQQCVVLVQYGLWTKPSMCGGIASVRCTDGYLDVRPVRACIAVGDCSLFRQALLTGLIPWIRSFAHRMLCVSRADRPCNSIFDSLLCAPYAVQAEAFARD